ncbi:MAG: purine-nucleoside phosphorylase [Flavobacteriales bacterium]|nr:purine-nucleoside phosphorylase [Flavobacteriales bacterium]
MKQIQEAVNFIKSYNYTSPKIGIILGTGLGGLLEKCQVELSIPYKDIPHFPEATVESHQGQLIFAQIENKSVVIMQGRFHYYEGYDAKEITFPVRVLKELGIGNLLISNASGALNTDYKKGDLVIVNDHINLLFDNPLRGKNIDEHGPRFTDMSEPYDPKLRDLLWKCSKKIESTFHTGVYAAWQGPSLETRAEYRMLKIIGADLVGMSTVPEVIVANHMSLPCAVVSVLTDECDPDQLKPVSIEEIIATARNAEPHLTQLFTMLIAEL